MNTKKLLTLKEAATALSYSARYVWELARQGEIESIGKRRGFRIIAASLDAYVERRRGTDRGAA